MARLKRPELAAQARRLNLEQLSRARRSGGRVTPAHGDGPRRELGAEGRAEPVARSAWSSVGDGGGTLSLDAWQRIGLALDRPLRIELSRDAREEPADAGHLGDPGARDAGGPRRRVPAEPSSCRPDQPTPPTPRTWACGTTARRRLILVECWNTIGDLGAAVRSTNRKRVEAEDLAAVIGGGRPTGRAGRTGPMNPASPMPWPPSGSSEPLAGTGSSSRATRSSSPADSRAPAAPGCKRSPPAHPHRSTWASSGATCAPRASTPGDVADAPRAAVPGLEHATSHHSRAISWPVASGTAGSCHSGGRRRRPTTSGEAARDAAST